MLHAEYWQTIAKGAELELAKGQMFLKGPERLMSVKGAILRRMLAGQTPRPFEIGSGFVQGPDADGNLLTSSRLDLIVYDPTVNLPKYRLEGLVVLSSHATRIAIEVLPALTPDGMHRVASRWDSLRPMATEEYGTMAVMGMAWDGIEFDQFVAVLANAIRHDPRNLPECVVVHGRNYLGIRPTQWTDPAIEPFYFAVNFHQAPELGPGMATAYFLQHFDRRLRSPQIPAEETYAWFNRLPLPENAKIRIAPRQQNQPGKTQ